MKKKALIVDDDGDILLALKVALESAGFEAETVGTGEGVIDKVKKNPPSVLLLDLVLPGTDGLEIARQLKSHSETKSIPIIMVSAYPESERFALESGVDIFIAKPFDIDYLVNTVKKYTEPQMTNSDTRP